MDFFGEFESHVTVGDAGTARVEALAAWAAARGIKFGHIVLARGERASQPMLTRAGRGTLTEELAAARAVAADLSAQGFAVVRVKVEASPWNAGVPAEDGEAVRLGKGMYFEHHVKVELPVGADLAVLAATAREEGGHLSKNARRVRADGREERFVTQRCHGVGRTGARAALDRLRARMVAGGYVLLEVEQEFVVYDSDVRLDAGWME